MVCSLHSHSGQFCLHARGKLEDIILQAIKLGFKTYGLSEHMPRYRQQDLYPEELDKTTVEGLSETFDAYVAEARRLQEKYKDQINIIVGAETENIHPETIGHVKALMGKYHLDYLVGSVHHVNEVPIDFSREIFDEAVKKAGGLDRLFEDYYDAQHQLLVEVRPEVIGHFDLINMFCVGHPLSPAVEEKMRRNISVAVSYGALFELNSSAFRKSLPGAHPQANAVKMIKELGGRFTLSDDCHGPGAVANNYHLLLEYLKNTGVTEIYHLKRGEAGVVEAIKVENIQEHPFWAALDPAEL